MRYKSQLSGKIKGFVEWQLEHYRDNRLELESYKNDMIPSPVPKYTDEPHGKGGESRPTENLALKMANSTYIMTLERSVKAIEYVISRLNDTDMRLIELVYFKAQYTVEGAGIVVGYSKTTAYSHVNAILAAIARELGYVNIE